MDLFSQIGVSFFGSVIVAIEAESTEGLYTLVYQGNLVAMMFLTLNTTLT